MIFKYITRGDIVLVAALVVLSCAWFFVLHGHGFDGKHAVVEVDGRRVMELSLDQDVTKTVAGPLGETAITVEDGSVRIADSPCPTHYCIRMGRLKHRGEIAVCVPNRVVVSIKGGREGDSFDGVTQ